MLELEIKPKTTIKKRKEIDYKILSLLQEDSRLSFSKIAHRLNISASTAFYHIKNLEKDKIIKKYSAILALDKLGYDLTSIILIQTKGESENIIKEIAESANVLAVYEITGMYNVAILTKFINKRSLNKFLKDLSKMQYIQKIETNLVLDVAKEDFYLNL